MIGIIFGTSVVSVIITLITIAVVYKICEIRKRKVEANTTAKTIFLENTSQQTKEPVYDDIEVVNENRNVDLSKNIAYVDINN